MITLLTTLCILLIIGLAYCVLHIKLINKELEKITEEQSLQNEDIRNMMNAHVNLVTALTQNVEEEIDHSKFYNIKAEA